MLASDGAHIGCTWLSCTHLRSRFAEWSLLQYHGLGLGAARDCSVRCSECVAGARSHDARRCVSLSSQGLRWASGQTSPRQGGVACIAGYMHSTCRHMDALCSTHCIILCLSLLNRTACASIICPHVDMGTSKASKRRQANRPGRRERAAERGGEPAADTEELSAEEDQTSATSQLACDAFFGDFTAVLLG